MNNNISDILLTAHSKMIDEIIKEFYKLYGGFKLVINLPYICHDIIYYSYDNEVAIDIDEALINISLIIKNAEFPPNITIWIKTPTNHIIYIMI